MLSCPTYVMVGTLTPQNATPKVPPIRAVSTKPLRQQCGDSLGQTASILGVDVAPHHSFRCCRHAGHVGRPNACPRTHEGTDGERYVVGRACRRVIVGLCAPLLRLRRNAPWIGVGGHVRHVFGAEEGVCCGRALRWA